MLELFCDVYRYRELIWVLALKELKVRYKRSTLGFVWALLHPLLGKERPAAGLNLQGEEVRQHERARNMHELNRFAAYLHGVAEHCGRRNCGDPRESRKR